MLLGIQRVTLALVLTVNQALLHSLLKITTIVSLAVQMHQNMESFWGRTLCGMVKAVLMMMTAALDSALLGFTAILLQLRRELLK